MRNIFQEKSDSYLVLLTLKVLLNQPSVEQRQKKLQFVGGNLTRRSLRCGPLTGRLGRARGNYSEKHIERNTKMFFVFHSVTGYLTNFTRSERNFY